MDLLGDGLEFVEVNEAILVPVVHAKHLLEAVFGLGLSDPGADDVQELIEGQTFVLIP